MNSYGQFCAMARALEVLGERWTLLVVREIMMGSHGFNEIRRGIPSISRDTLTKRLRTLERAEIVARHNTGSSKNYELTNAGESLMPLMAALAGWAYAWDRRGLLPEHLDPDALLWDLHRRMDPAAAPSGRVAVEFVLSDQSHRMWLILKNGRAQLCTTSGGYSADLRVDTDTETLSNWWLGELDWATATRTGAITLTGRTDLVRGFPHWFLGYALAPQL